MRNTQTKRLEEDVDEQGTERDSDWQTQLQKERDSDWQTELQHIGEVTNSRFEDVDGRGEQRETDTETASEKSGKRQTQRLGGEADGRTDPAQRNKNV